MEAARTARCELSVSEAQCDWRYQVRSHTGVAEKSRACPGTKRCNTGCVHHGDRCQAGIGCVRPSLCLLRVRLRGALQHMAAIFVLFAVSQGSSRASESKAKGWRVQGGVQDPEARYLDANGACHLSLGEGEIRTLRERR
jgi:hypothetical protein